MFKDIKITLYDIFGYLLPGSVFLAGMAILFWAIFLPKVALVFGNLTTEGWILILLVSYISGHMVQGLGNGLENLFQSPEDLLLKRGNDSLPEGLIQTARVKAGEVVGVDLKDFGPKWFFRICDEAVVQFGVNGDREVFQYREGFYRGLTVSFIFLFLSFILRLFIPGTMLEISGVSRSINTPVLLFFIVIFGCGALVSFFRYRRFAKYRVSKAILGFLTLQGKRNLQKSGEKEA